MQAGEAGLVFPIDSEAGTSGNIPTTAGSTAQMIIASQPVNQGGQSSYVVVGSSRLVPNGDNRTYNYTTAATDHPFAGTYGWQLVLMFSGGVVRKSPVVTVSVAPSLAPA